MNPVGLPCVWLGIPMKRLPLLILALVAVVCGGLLLLRGPLGLFPAAEPPKAVTAPVSGSANSIEGTAAGLEAESVESSPQREQQQRRVSGPAVFRLLDSDGRPVVDARILIARGDVLLLDKRTDAVGRVESAADGQAALLVVRLDTRPLQAHDVSLDEGLREISLFDGDSVAGRLVGEDGSGLDGLTLRLDSDHPPSFDADIPPAISTALGAHAVRSGVAWTTTEEGGQFEFAGLSPTWSGGLGLPRGWRVVRTTAGQLEPHARGLHFEAPLVELLISLVPDRTLRGRVVSSRGGDPVGEASLSAMVRSPDSSDPEFLNTKTDEDGHFELRRRAVRISSLDLRLGAAFHDSSSILRLDGEAIPEDGDLGDIAVEQIRHVSFVLQDSDGTPIPGGTAIAGGSRSQPTDAQGRSVLRFLSLSVKTMRVEADGYVPAEHGIPQVVVDPIVVILEPATRLEVHLTVPEGGNPGQFKVLVLRKEGVTACPVADQAEQRAHVGSWGYPPVSLMREPLGSFLVAAPDRASGLAVFMALEPHVPIELEVHGITGNMVYHEETLAPLGPAEHRRHEVSLADAVVAFRGRVLDQDGNSLARASLQLTNQILGWTNDEGEFLCFVRDAPPGTLLVQHSACQTLYLEDYVIPTDGRPVEFLLSAPQRVEVEVVDTTGAPVPQAEVRVRHGRFTSNTHRLEGHRHVIRSAPGGTFRIVARLAGHEYTIEHDSSEPNARIEVPEHGSLVARIASEATAGRAGSFLIVLDLDDGSVPFVGSAHDASPDLAIEMPAILPGEYQASLHYEPTEDEAAAGRQAEESGSLSVTVVAGERAELRIGLSP